MGTLKDMLSKALEMRVCFHIGPASGEHGRFLGPLREKKNLI